jgi:hypothetical protein
VSSASDRGEFTARELEIEDVEILRDPCWLDRLGDRRAALLQEITVPVF